MYRVGGGSHHAGIFFEEIRGGKTGNRYDGKVFFKRLQDVTDADRLSDIFKIGQYFSVRHIFYCDLLRNCRYFQLGFRGTNMGGEQYDRRKDKLSRAHGISLTKAAIFLQIGFFSQDREDKPSKKRDQQTAESMAGNLGYF